MSALLVMLGLGIGWLAGQLANWAADALPQRVMRPAATDDGSAPEERNHKRRRLAVQIGLALLFGLLAVRYGHDPAMLAVSFAYAWLLTTVLVIDLETRRVLNIMLLPGAIFALAVAWALGAPGIPSALAGGLTAFVLFWGLYILGRILFGRGALGFGDVKLAGVIGLMTGYPDVMRALMIGVVLGAVAAIVLLASRRAGWKSTSAYAPYLALGAMLAMWTQLGG